MKYLSYLFVTIASALLVILLSLLSCSPTQKTTISQTPIPSQTSQQTADVTVKIRNFKFEPANLTIAVGKTVRFINVDEEPHTATSTDGSFDSKALDTDGDWNYTATKQGNYPYICSVHPFMKGTLTVTP